MTYIVAGKINEKPFLAVDAKSMDKSNGQEKYKYIEKLWRLKSVEKETYFSLSGQALIPDLISMYDIYLQRKGVLFDFTNKYHIKKLIRFINYIMANYLPNYEFELNVLYFISATDVCKYWLIPNKNKSNFKIIPKICEINNNQITNSNSNYRHSIENGSDIKAFCKTNLLKISKKYDKDLRDRISYVISDGTNLEYTEPHKSYYDIVAMFFNLDFETLDKVEFKFEE
jgi:hypothetical protein